MIEQLSMIPDVPQARRRPAEPIIRTAVVVDEGENRYRFRASRCWGTGPMIFWGMCNPSIADGTRDDPTMWRVIEFSYRWGFGGCLVGNIYPFVTPSMKMLERWRRLYHPRETKFDDYELGNVSALKGLDAVKAYERNQTEVRAMVQEAKTYVAAWGNDIDPKDLEQFLRMARPTVDTSEHDGFGDQPVPIGWHCIGTNKDGSPKHPLARGVHRVPNDQKLVMWRKAE